jgi:hypothetical protein
MIMSCNPSLPERISETLTSTGVIPQISLMELQQLSNAIRVYANREHLATALKAKIESGYAKAVNIQRIMINRGTLVDCPAFFTPYDVMIDSVCEFLGQGNHYPGPSIDREDSYRACLHRLCRYQAGDNPLTLDAFIDRIVQSIPMAAQIVIFGPDGANRRFIPNLSTYDGIEEALKWGISVPEDILFNYPELLSKYGVG